MRRDRFRIPRGRSLAAASARRAPPLILVLALVFAGPVLASDRFGDVPASNIHHGDISAIAAAGITRGCHDGTVFCPKDAVLREQMASFLARTAGLGGHPPVVNADRLDGLDSSAFLQAGDYTVMQLGPWHPGNPATAVQHGLSATTVSADTLVVVRLGLEGPASIGQTTYGFETARICFLESPGVTIGATSVFQATDTSEEVLVHDGIARPMTSDGCYSVADTTPTPRTGGATLSLFLGFETATTAVLKSVTTTWTPVSP